MKLTIFSLICLVLQTKAVFGQWEWDCPSGYVCYMPHTDCTKYIMCIYSRPSVLECQPDLYYNPRSERCEYPENVPECVGGTRPPETTTVQTTTTTEVTPTEEETLEPEPSTTEVPTTTEETPTEEETQEPEPSTTEIPTTTDDIPTEEETLEPEPSTTETLPPNTLTDCGQNIKADSGFIQYKVNQNYSAGELCAFVIQLDQHEGCQFTLETYGISDPDSDTITVFNVSPAENFDTVILSNTNPTDFLFYSTFVVVFKTETNLGTGFRMKFESRPAVTVKAPGDHIAFNNQTSEPLRFPFYPEIYTRGERDTVVITAGAKILTNSSSQLQLRVENDFYNPGCQSWYRVHSWDGTVQNLEGEVCGTNEGNPTLYFHTKGLFIVVFFKMQLITYESLGSLEWVEIN